MLTRADFGLKVVGRVDSIGELRFREGKTEKGKDWSFWQQTITLTVGGLLFEIAFRSEKEPAAPLVTFDLDEIVQIKVENPRSYNGKVSFDACKD